HRPEVGAADADIDDVANAFAGVALPFAVADAVGESGHLVEHGMDLRHDILAIDHDGRPFRRAQRHVQDRAIFRDVDFLAGEPRVDSLAQPGLFGERDEQSQCLVIDAMFRIIEKDADGLRRHPLAAFGIMREQVSQMAAAHCLVVILERPPCRLFSCRLRARYLRSSSHVPRPQVQCFERAPPSGRACCHSRNPPAKALSLSPARSALSFLTLPPPMTVWSGSSAAMKPATTSATWRHHFFLPYR